MTSGSGALKSLLIPIFFLFFFLPESSKKVFSAFSVICKCRSLYENKTQNGQFDDEGTSSSVVKSAVRVDVCGDVGDIVLLTRPAGEARLNSARTLASPKEFNSTHMTGKRRGRMGSMPISCKYNFRSRINIIYVGRPCSHILET